jgi:thiol-disulfide isomerase/thioredoxin
MKKLISFLVICSYTIAGRAQIGHAQGAHVQSDRAQNNVTVNASIKGLDSGQWVYWYPLTRSNQMDSLKTAPGGFQIKLQVPDGEADAYVVKIGKAYIDNGFVLLYLDKGMVSIEGSGPLFKNAKTSGDQATQDYNAYEDFIKADSLKAQRAELYKKAGSLGRKDSLGQRAVMRELKKMDSTERALTKQWLLAHNTSLVSAFILSSRLIQLDLEVLGKPDPEETEDIFNRLSPGARDNAPAKRIANSIRINELTGIGKTALDFTQNDTLGKPVSLKDFRGKYVLLDFWASWCVPCRAENPNIVAAYNKYKDRGFTILSVSLDMENGKDKWLNAIHKDHLAWTNVSDLKFWKNAVARLYDINAVPANLLLDPDGKIIAKNLHGDELGKKLDEVLRAKPFTLTGNIIGQDSGKIKLSYMDVSGKTVRDSTMIRDGHFMFSGRISEPCSVSLVGSVEAGIGFFIDPADMTMDLKAGDFKDAVITGSKTEDEYRALQALEQPIHKEEEPLAKEFRDASEAYREAKKAKADDVTLDSLQYRAARVHDRFEPYFARLAKVDYNFFAAHPQSYITALMLGMHVTELSLDSLQMFYGRFGTALQNTGPGKKIAEGIDRLRAGSPGSIAGNFTAKDMNGNDLTLSSFKGKYVLIDFWASWCVPCRKSTPHVKELYSLYKAKGLEVIGVSDDDKDTTAWEKAVAKDGTGIWRNVLRGLDWEKVRKNEKNENDISQKFGVVSLPTKILIDPNGVIIGRYDKGTEEEEAVMDKKLAETLGS